MGLAKKATTTVVQAEPNENVQVTNAIMKELEAKVESGSEAALSRLKVTPKSETVKAIEKVQYKQRDFDKEARGKVKCVMFEAALQSPAIAGMQFNTMEEYLSLVEKAANAGVEYTWSE